MTNPLMRHGVEPTPPIGPLGANRLSIHHQATGARTVLLLDDDGLADPYTAAHLLGLTKRGHSVSSVRNTALGIHRGLEFCREAGIAYVERCKGDYLTDPELDRLVERMRGTGATPRATADRDFIAFVNFLVSVGGRVRSGSDEGGRTGELFRKAAAERRPGDSDRPVRKRLGLEPGQRAAFRAAIVPGSPRNPFDRTAFRNFALMSTAYWLGLRSGELLSLKVCDLILDADCRLRVVRRPRDPEDPRQLPALVKTAGRDLALGPDLAALYVGLLEQRAECDRANRHQYVFVNYRGDPLDQRGLRKIYQKFRDRNPEFSELINHILRHDWNDRWKDLVRELGMHPDEASLLQNDFMGWSKDSKMGHEVYGQRSVHDEANRILLAMQDRNRSVVPGGGRR